MWNTEEQSDDEDGPDSDTSGFSTEEEEEPEEPAAKPARRDPFAQMPAYFEALDTGPSEAEKVCHEITDIATYAHH